MQVRWPFNFGALTGAVAPVAQSIHIPHPPCVGSADPASVLPPQCRHSFQISLELYDGPPLLLPFTKRFRDQCRRPRATARGSEFAATCGPTGPNLPQLLGVLTPLTAAALSFCLFRTLDGFNPLWRPSLAALEDDFFPPPRLVSSSRAYLCVLDLASDSGGDLNEVPIDSIVALSPSSSTGIGGALPSRLRPLSPPPTTLFRFVIAGDSLFFAYKRD